MKRKMEPLLIELLLIITLTVCASSSSQPFESTQSPLLGVEESSKKVDLQHQEIRLNITLKKGDEDEKENVDIEMGK